MHIAPISDWVNVGPHDIFVTITTPINHLVFSTYSIMMIIFAINANGGLNKKLWIQS